MLITKFRKPPRRDFGPPVNGRCLRYPLVRVIDSTGQNLGVLTSQEALSKAQSQDLDLLMISPTVDPPVCRILDYGRHKYETDKMKKESKKKQQELKGIKIRPNTAEHDLSYLIKNAQKFLAEGDKVKVTCQFRAREVMHPEIGRAKLDFFAKNLEEHATIDSSPKLEGKLMIMILIPKIPKVSKQNGKEQAQD